MHCTPAAPRVVALTTSVSINYCPHSAQVNRLILIPALPHRGGRAEKTLLRALVHPSITRVYAAQPPDADQPSWQAATMLPPIP